METVSRVSAEFDRAKAAESRGPAGWAEAAQRYKGLVMSFSTADDPEDARFVEQSVTNLCSLMVQKSEAHAIAALQEELRPVFLVLPRAKTAKIVRAIIDALAKVPGSEDLQVQACKDCIAWCVEGKRTFLRQRVEAKLAALYLSQSKFQPALELLTVLLKEVRKLDDKVLLVEGLVIETRIHLELKNVPKSKASLTAAKANANAIHCPPSLQADIDMLSGILNAREGDFKTSYSYFYEAFEALNQLGDSARALDAIKYMILAKIMADSPGDANIIGSSKSGLKYAGPELHALLEVAKTQQQRSLLMFEETVSKYGAYLTKDPVIAHHLHDLNETLLEQNLLKIVEPYSRVEIAHVASVIRLSEERVLKKLSDMILDGKLFGTLDQGIGVLVVFEKQKVGSFYSDILSCIENTSVALDSLHEKSLKLVA